LCRRWEHNPPGRLKPAPQHTKTKNNFEEFVKSAAVSFLFLLDIDRVRKSRDFFTVLTIADTFCLECKLDTQNILELAFLIENNLITFLISILHPSGTYCKSHKAELSSLKNYSLILKYHNMARMVVSINEKKIHNVKS
jgi:hypothetical protein